jgi:phosphoribosylformylglycinamidine cyclo-ligase
MAHVTGGGLLENIIRVVPDGLGLAIESSSWKLPPVFDWLQREGKVPREEMWRTFNCGIGFTVILAPGDVAGVQAALSQSGLASTPIGEVVEAGDKRVHIA